MMIPTQHPAFASYVTSLCKPTVRNQAGGQYQPRATTPVAQPAPQQSADTTAPSSAPFTGITLRV